MTRGNVDEPRRRDVRVRLTDAEYARWNAARAKSGRREMGAWVRAVVDELLTGQRVRRRPGDLPYRRVPPVNVDAYRHLVAAASNLNQLARWCHVERRAVDAATLRRVAGELETLAWSVRGSRRPSAPAGRTDQPPPLPLLPAVPRPRPAPPVEQFVDVERVDQADADAVAGDVAGSRGRRWFRRSGGSRS